MKTCRICRNYWNKKCAVFSPPRRTEPDKTCGYWFISDSLVDRLPELVSALTECVEVIHDQFDGTPVQQRLLERIDKLLGSLSNG